MPKPTYTEIPKGMKLSKDLKDFREFCLVDTDVEFATNFERRFQNYCKHHMLKQADALRIASERL